MNHRERPLKSDHARSFLLGGLLILLTGIRFSIQPVAWIAAAPLLAPLFKMGGGWKRGLALLGVLLAAYHVAVAEIATRPLSLLMAPMFALPFALGAFLSIAFAGTAYRRLGPRWGIYSYPAAVVIFEWIFHTFTPQSSWGSLVFTQSQNLTLMQATTILGPTGVSFLVALGSSLAAAVAVGGWKPRRKDLAVFIALFIGAHTFGELRLIRNPPGEPVTMAAVASPFAAEDTRKYVASPALARGADEDLFERTRLAARRGAKIVVWNEAATFLERPDEAPLVGKGQAVARETGIDLIMAFGVLVSRDPLRFENKYLWIRPDGRVAEEYWKRHPVPGEGSIPGTKRALVLPLDPVNPEKGRAGGGICYDADFPEVPLWLARSGAGLMLLPSSDWRGIDPLHSDMARIMGLSVGLSVFRSVRSATSMASDQFGRVLASRRFYIGGDGVMVAEVPALPVPTLYAKIGESFPVACLAFGLLGSVLIIGKTRRGRRAGSQP